MRVSRVLGLVDAMPEPHDPLPPAQPFLDVTLSVGRVAHLLQHLHGLLVGPAVERALEGADGPGDRGEHVGQGRGDHASGERGGIHGVVRVEDQGGVQGRGVGLLGFVSGEHVQEVRRMRELRVGRHDHLTGSHPVVHREQRRRLRDEAEGLALVRLGTVVPPIGVIGGRGGDAGPKHRHRRRLLGQGRHQSLEEWRDLSLGDQSLRKLVEIGLGWELEVVEKVGDLLEGRLGRQVVDVIAHVPQAPLLAVDVGQAGRCGDDLFQSSLRHRPTPILNGGSKPPLTPRVPRGTRRAATPPVARTPPGGAGRMGPSRPWKEPSMATYRVTLIPGDGVGPELSEATRRVLEATGVGFDWDVQEAGADVVERYGTPLPDPVLESIRRNRAAIKGPITTPVGSGFRSVNVALRKELDLYACLRPCKWYRGVRSRYEDVDVVIVRENTEDLYAGIEFEEGSRGARELIEFIAEKTGKRIRDDAGISIKPISAWGTERIVRFAFDYARSYGRTKVTAVHKANIMKFTDGLFLETARRVAETYADIGFEDRIVDNLTMQLVQRPEEYDVLVLPNLYGDIVSDLCAGLIGGLGVAPGANIGDEAAVFEATHGSAPKYKGMNKVNPMAMMLSGVLMLRHLGETEAADRLESGIAAVIAEGKSVTYDMKPSRDDPTAVGTSQVADAVIEKLQA